MVPLSIQAAMSVSQRRPFSLALLAALALGLSLSCTETVYRDRSQFNPPPDSSSGYLGYYTASTKQTTCGNCHVGQQQDWVQTVHAGAWDTLVSDPAAQTFCQGCHTVNSRGNRAFANVGYDKVKDAAYHDVQCESCHGPGYTHVQNPSVPANRPIPSMLIYPNSTSGTDTAAIVNSGCGGCHTDNTPAKHHNYLKEWLSSRHGQLNQHAAPTAACQPIEEAAVSHPRVSRKPIQTHNR